MSVTFVTIGPLQGKTINLGPDGGKYRFVNGEMKVPDELAGLLGTALRFYAAFPKGDAPQYHAQLCAKLKIDPKTLQPLDSEVVAQPESEAVPEAVPVEEPVDEPSVKEMDAALSEVLLRLEEGNDEHWTKSGQPSLAWVKAQLPANIALFTDRKTVDAFNMVRQG